MARNTSTNKEKTSAQKASGNLSKSGTRKSAAARSRAVEAEPRILDDRTRRDIVGVGFIILGIVLFIAAAAPAGAIVTDFLSESLHVVFGVGCYIMPFFLVAIGGAVLYRMQSERMSLRVTLGLSLILVALLGIIALFTPTTGTGPAALFDRIALVNHGGYVGAALAWVGLTLFGPAISAILLIGVAIVGVIVLMLTIFGAGIVRAASTYMGMAILVTAISIYVIGIFKSDSSIFSVLAADFETTGFMNMPKAILNAFTYAGFQCVTLPTMIACGTTMKNKAGCAKAMWISFVMNAVALVLSVFMLMNWQSVYTSVEGGATIPTLTVCKIIGIPAMVAVYGTCLLLCLISTGVTTIFGFVARFEKLPVFSGIQSAPVRSAIVSAFIIVLSMTISMAGLTNIIKYGYGYCGYLGIAVVVVPFLTVGVYKNRKYCKEHAFANANAEEEAAPAVRSSVRANPVTAD